MTDDEKLQRALLSDARAEDLIRRLESGDVANDEVPPLVDAAREAINEVRALRTWETPCRE